MTDVVRSKYRNLTDQEKERILLIKDLATKLIVECNDQTREMALARTNIEQGVMWAVKGITG